MDAIEVDVAVVGAGITGAVAAHFLAEAGLSVALIERAGEPGSGGATARAPGLVLTGTGDHVSRVARGTGAAEAAALWRFSVENGRIVGDLVERLRVDCGYEARGSWAVAASEAEERDLRESIELIERERIECAAALIDGAALEREPRAPRGRAAIRCGRDAALDVPAFVRALAGALPRGRARVLERADVRALVPSASGVRLDTAAGEVRAEIAIVAANAWAPALHSFFDGLVFPVRGQGFVTGPLPARVLDRPVSANWGHELYRQLPGGRLVAAGFRPGTTEDEVGYDETVSEVFQGFLEKFAAQRIPGLPDPLPIERRFAGIDGFSQDGLPLVGPIPGQPKILAACGFNMRGLSLGAAAGRAVARLAIDGTREAPACLSPGRFL